MTESLTFLQTFYAFDDIGVVRPDNHSLRTHAKYISSYHYQKSTFFKIILFDH